MMGNNGGERQTPGDKWNKKREGEGRRMVGGGQAEIEYNLGYDTGCGYSNGGMIKA